MLPIPTLCRLKPSAILKSIVLKPLAIGYQYFLGEVILAKTETWILLRGWMRHHGHWFGFDQALAKHRHQLAQVHASPRVCTIDLLGNGRFVETPSPRQITQQARHLYTQLQAQDNDGDIFIVALSMAGLVAIAALWSEPETLTSAEPALGQDNCHADWRTRVKGLILINPSVRGQSYVWERLRPRAWPRVMQRLIWLKPWQLEQDLVQLTVNNRALWPAIIKHNRQLLSTYPITRTNALNQLVSAARFSLTGFPNQFPKPLLVLSGKGDRLVASASGLRLAQRLGGHFALHPTGGHDLTTDAPEWVLAQITQWLANARSPECLLA